MKNIVFATFLSLILSGCCSIPQKADYGELYSITKEEKTIKAGFGSKQRIEIIKDFKDNDRFDEDIEELKQKAQDHILAHPELSEKTKDDLLNLRVAQGQNSEEVRLLLGNPDSIKKIRRKDYNEIWIYKTSRPSVFSIIVFPLYFGREELYLYFNDNLLIRIERRSLKQTFHTTDPDMREKSSSE